MTLADDPDERRSFLYFDIISWLDSKIEDKRVADVIRQKFVQAQNNAIGGE